MKTTEYRQPRSVERLSFFHVQNPVSFLPVVSHFALAATTPMVAGGLRPDAPSSPTGDYWVALRSCREKPDRQTSDLSPVEGHRTMYDQLSFAMPEPADESLELLLARYRAMEQTCDAHPGTTLDQDHECAMCALDILVPTTWSRPYAGYGLSGPINHDQATNAFQPYGWGHTDFWTEVEEIRIRLRSENDPDEVRSRRWMTALKVAAGGVAVAFTSFLFITVLSLVA